MSEPLAVTRPRIGRPATLAAAMVLMLAPVAARAGNADLVDPFIGTAAGSQSYAKGNTFPGAVVPNGMVAISPDTNPRYPGGYRSGAAYIEGFSQNHMSGVGGSGDLGNILLMPTTGAVRTTETGYRSGYSAEVAKPGYYRVQLTTPRVVAEISATTRASISKLTFPTRTGDANIIVDVSHGLTASRGGSVKIISGREVEGYNDTGGFSGVNSPYKVYFVARFSKSSVARGTWTGASTGTAGSRTGSDIGAYFRFTTAASEAVFVRLGLSYVSIANARANLDAEIPNTKSFDQVAAAALARWNADLGKIQVTGGTEAQRRIFYTALYHALLHPGVNSDVNQQYQGMGGSGVKTATGYTHYHLFSLWDTYRSLHPLLSLLYPGRQQDMVRSMVAMYRESGWLPKWEYASRETNIMVGDPAAIVLADTYLKGIRGFDVATAYEAMRKSAVTTTGNPLRPCLSRYLASKYIPQGVCTKKGSVSITQEYNYADYAVARLAQALGKTADYQSFSVRSLYYRNLFDSTSGFLRPRNSDGSWMTPFDPLCCSLGTGKYEGPGYVEGTAWQYLFMIPFDVDGLKALLGGDLAFVAKLDQAFTPGGSYYSLINEPDMLYPYLYTFVPGQAWRTQARVRQDIADNFTTARSGLPGNDDAGQTSSRLVFDMLGFYPVNPLSNSYEIGSPVFDTAILSLDQGFYPGTQFVIQANSNTALNKYVQSALLNGQPLRTAHLAHETLVAGGTLTLNMGGAASTWGD